MSLWRARMCGYGWPTKLISVTSTLLWADPAIIALVLASWIWAARRATALPDAATARELSRRCGGILAIIGVGLFLFAGLGLGAVLGSATGWFARQSVALPPSLRVSLTLLLLACVVTVVVSVPRLIAIRTTGRAFNGVNAMPPALRHEAAHPLLAWPVQLAAGAAAASEVVFFVGSYPAVAGFSPAALTVVALVSAGAGVAAVASLARRHARFAGDVIVPRRPIRQLRAAPLRDLGP